jgi:hypothetical protein
VTTARTFTATAIASKDDLAIHPGVLAVVIAAEKARVEADMAAAGMRRSGAWRQSTFWARGDDTTTPHSWARCLKRNASARVVHLSADAVPR